MLSIHYQLEVYTRNLKRCAANSVSLIDFFKDPGTITLQWMKLIECLKEMDHG